MRRRILIALAAFLYYSGLVGIARWWTRRAQARLVILNYHRASGGDLRGHLQYLRRYYRVMHIEAALEELYAARKEQRHTSSGKTVVAVTFDDGYRDNYTHGFALACELQTPMTIYLVPGYIENGQRFWWFEGKRLVQSAQVQEASVEGLTYHLQQEDERAALASLIDRRVRFAHSVTERETFLATMRAVLVASSSVVEEEQPELPLTWEQVHEMEQSGWVSFGAHTMHHPILSYLTDPAERERELRECRMCLEDILGHAVHTFAYPIGQQQHIGSETVTAVRQAGYTWAVTTHYGINTPTTDRLTLQRVEVDVDQHWLVVAAATAGLWGFIARLRWLPAIRKRFTNSR